MGLGAAAWERETEKKGKREEKHGREEKRRRSGSDDGFPASAPVLYAVGDRSSVEGKRECHIEPDFLLVYQIVKSVVILYLIRVGSHSEIYK